MADNYFRDLVLETAQKKQEKDPKPPKPPRGFLGRLHAAVNGFGGALAAPFGLVKDFASAPFTDDEYDGIVGSLYHYTVNRGGQFFGSALGPDKGVGALAGGLPEGVRQPARSVLNPVTSGLETAYREGVSQPTSAVLLANQRGGGSTAGAQFGLGVLNPVQFLTGALLNFDKIPAAYEEAQKVSPGQAFATGVYGVDRRNKAQLARFVASDAYEVVSGTADAVLRLGGDPGVIAGKVGAAARLKYLVQPIESMDDINRAMESTRIAKFREAALGKSAAEIRNQFFPDHSHGAVISSILSEASTKETFDSTLRALMGDKDELARIAQTRADIAGQLTRALQDQSESFAIKGSANMPTLFEDPERAALVNAEIDALYPEAYRAERLASAGGSIRTVPRVTVPGRMRASDFYQSSPWAKPLHVVFDMEPHRLVNLHDPQGDVQVSRMLQKSALPQETQDALRTEYMAALSPGERQTAVIKAETMAVKSLADKAGMTVDEVEDILRQAGRNRARAAQVVKSRAYDAEGRSRFFFESEDGVVTQVDLPIWNTQEANILPLVDLDEVKRATTRIGQFRLRHPATDIPRELVEGFYRLWRPSVLLRVGWPIRIIGDEQLRIIAKVDALTQAESLVGSAKNYLADAFSGVERGARGVRGMEVRGYQMEGAFGAPGDAENVMRHLVDANASFKALTGQADIDAKKINLSTAQWRTITPDEAGHGQAWAHAVNNQIGQDEMGRKFLSGASVDEVADWLVNDDAGRAYARRNAVRAHNPRAWAHTAEDQVNAYLPSDELKQLALSRRASADDLARVIPDAAERPLVHGEQLAEAFGQGVLGQTLSATVNQAFDWLGRRPTNVLSRNRFFDHMYRAESQRLVGLLDDGQLTEDVLRQVEDMSRQYALRQTRTLLYDLAEQSRLGEMLKFFVPFYAAFQEVITRWAGLAVENPAFIRRMHLVWQAPEKAGIVTDENGRKIEWGKKYKEGERGAERFVTISLPEWAKDIPGLQTQGSVAFNKQSFNLALQGSPGMGPPVQIAVNEIVKNRPELEDSVKFVLPYGTSQSIKDMLLPATAKRIDTLAGGEEDRAYFNSLMRIYFDKVVDYNLGKRKDKPTYEEAKKEADAFYKLRTVASFVSPAAPGFKSPYQHYIDAYRNAKERLADDKMALADEDGNERTADEWFLDEYGDAYFPLTQSLSKSVDGVPPTLEGYNARKKYRDLIEKHPELGGLIIGAEGAGEFSRAVYDAQLASRVRPGSATKQRERPDFEEAAGSPEARRGWIEYVRIMDLIEAERVDRGLPNLQVKGARDLAEMKRQFIDKLTEKYPEWANEFGITDENKWKKRISGLREISSDDRLAGRDEIARLRDYLEARDALQAELSKRKAKTLSAASNADLAATWAAIVGKMTEKNLAFQDLFFRYLERDPVTNG